MLDSARRFRIVFVTAPDMRTARRLAKLALEQRLVACANLVPRLESHYWWAGKIEHGREVMVLFKTTKRLLARLERLVLEEHPYDTPEFVALTIGEGSRRYLRWCQQVARP